MKILIRIFISVGCASIMSGMFIDMFYDPDYETSLFRIGRFLVLWPMLTLVFSALAFVIYMCITGKWDDI